jgi:hypothetical protein
LRVTTRHSFYRELRRASCEDPALRKIRCEYAEFRAAEAESANSMKQRENDGNHENIKVNVIEDLDAKRWISVEFPYSYDLEFSRSV